MPWKPDQSRVHRSFHSMQNSRSAWLKRQKQGANCGSFTEHTRGNRRDTVGVNIWSALNRAAQWGADTHTWLQCITYSCPCFTKGFHLYLFDTPLKAFTLLLTLYSLYSVMNLRLKDALLHFFCVQSGMPPHTLLQCFGLFLCFFFFILLLLLLLLCAFQKVGARFREVRSGIADV